MTTRTRLFARFGVLAVVMLVLAMLPTGSGAAADEPQTCKDLPGFTTNLEGGTSGVWGSATFTPDDGPLTLTVNAGYRVWVCVKKGAEGSEGGGGVYLYPDPYVGPGTFEIGYPETPMVEGFSHYAIKFGKDTTTTTDGTTTTTDGTTTTTEGTTTTTALVTTTTMATTTTEEVTTTTEEVTTTTIEEEVAGEVVEQTTEEVLGDGAEALPRTGGSAALGLVAAGLLGLGGGLVAAARRRELES